MYKGQAEVAEKAIDVQLRTVLEYGIALGSRKGQRLEAEADALRSQVAALRAENASQRQQMAEMRGGR